MVAMAVAAVRVVAEQQAGALTGLARQSLLPAITKAASSQPETQHLNGARNGSSYENGDRNGRRKRQTPVTITDPASAGTDGSEEHGTQ